jgi:hypothetical protein
MVSDCLWISFLAVSIRMSLSAAFGTTAIILLCVQRIGSTLGHSGYERRRHLVFIHSLIFSHIIRMCTLPLPENLTKIEGNVNMYRVHPTPASMKKLKSSQENFDWNKIIPIPSTHQQRLSSLFLIGNF